MLQFDHSLLQRRHCVAIQVDKGREFPAFSRVLYVTAFALQSDARSSSNLRDEHVYTVDDHSTVHDSVCSEHMVCATIIVNSAP